MPKNTLSGMIRLAAAAGVFMVPMSITAQTLNYPETRKVDQVDDYHGTRVADPYRWLEDDRSAETAAWVAAENKVTFGYLEQIPFRAKVKQRLEQLYNYPKYGAPFRRAANFFYSKNDGLQNQSVIYVQQGLDGAPEPLIDPNKLSADGTVRRTVRVRPAGTSTLAYATSWAGGSSAAAGKVR